MERGRNPGPQFGVGRTIEAAIRATLPLAELREGGMIKRIRVEPISTYLERYRKAQAFPVTIANGFVFLSGLPPFDPETGEVKQVAFERQAEIVLAQMKHCLEAAGSSLGHVLKCNVYCTPDPSHFAFSVARFGFDLGSERVRQSEIQFPHQESVRHRWEGCMVDVMHTGRK